MATELDFNEVDRGYESNAVELTSNTFALHLEFIEKDNKVSILRSSTGSNFIKAKDIPYHGKVLDMTFTDAVPGMSIKVVCNNEPYTGAILQ